jgi:CBS domain-containing protein
MLSVRQLLEKKGHDVYSVAPDASVFDAIKTMADKGIGALLVMDGEDVIGIMSERDYARKVILKGRSSRETPVKDIMTDRVLFVEPDRTLNEAMALMTDKRIRHLPVMESDKLVGIFSVGDVIKAIISEQKFIIDQLESYIKGR